MNEAVKRISRLYGFFVFIFPYAGEEGANDMEMVRIRLCPCGTRLERRAGEGPGVFEKRRYCNSRCRGRYHQPKLAESHFGFKTPLDKSKLRAGPGMQAYLGSYRSRVW